MSKEDIIKANNYKIMLKKVENELINLNIYLLKNFHLKNYYINAKSDYLTQIKEIKTFINAFDKPSDWN